MTQRNEKRQNCAGSIPGPLRVDGGGTWGVIQGPLTVHGNAGNGAVQKPLTKIGHQGAAKLKISGIVVGGGPLSTATIIAVNAAAEKTPSKWRRYIAYADKVKVGGALAWRANNPGNLRDASTKIGTVPGAVGHFAVFASMEDGRAAQRSLYVNKYGAMTVRDAIYNPKTKEGLTPPSENDTTDYLAKLKAAGVDLDKDVKSQIDLLMKAVMKNEGRDQGTEVARMP
jgi:hypothetical protein